MTDVKTTDFSDEALKQRSYLIWQREGCPMDAALDHWVRARTELEEEIRRQRSADRSGGEALLRDTSRFVTPRLPISTRPHKIVSMRLRLKRAARRS